MASAGRILIMPKGNYDANTEYNMLDLVSHNGKSWLAKKNVVGIEPSESNSDYWQDMFDISAENTGSIQRTIWKWGGNSGNSLFSFIKSKLAEGYTCGMIQVELTDGGLSDIPQSVISKVGTYFMCSFQRHYYDYVRATIWGDNSTYEYSNWGVLADASWATTWTERMCPSGYLPKSGGTVEGNIYLKRDVPEYILHVSTNRTGTFHKNATATGGDAGTAMIDKSEIDGKIVRTILSIQDGKMRLHKQVDGVEVGSTIVAEITE